MRLLIPSPPDPTLTVDDGVPMLSATIEPESDERKEALATTSTSSLNRTVA
jgi:hypothetical protein